MMNSNPGDPADGGGGGGGETTASALSKIPAWVWPVIAFVVLGGGFLALKLFKVF